MRKQSFECFTRKDLPGFQWKRGKPTYQPVLLRGCVRDFQADFTIGVKHYVAFLRNFYVV